MKIQNYYNLATNVALWHQAEKKSCANSPSYFICSCLADSTTRKRRIFFFFFVCLNILYVVQWCKAPQCCLTIEHNIMLAITSRHLGFT